MKTYAHFKSLKTPQGLKVFRYFTEFHSENGPGDEIGLVVMMNPGDARPENDGLFSKLMNDEYDTKGPVATKPDNTMSKVMRLIKQAYHHNGLSLPMTYTIHVENLFNIREKNSDKAIRLARSLEECNEVMFRTRELNERYNFVLAGWGKVSINSAKQREIIQRYSNAIIVQKLNRKGTILDVDYPVHPLYMNTEYFLNASIGKIERVIGNDRVSIFSGVS